MLTLQESHDRLARLLFAFANGSLSGMEAAEDALWASGNYLEDVKLLREISFAVINHPKSRYNYNYDANALVPGAKPSPIDSRD